MPHDHYYCATTDNANIYSVRLTFRTVRGKQSGSMAPLPSHRVPSRPVVKNCTYCPAPSLKYIFTVLSRRNKMRLPSRPVEGNIFTVPSRRENLPS